MTLSRVCSLALLFLLPCGGAHAFQAAAPEPVTFERSVRPILKAYCFVCHGEEDQPKGDLDLRLVRLMKIGGDSGPAIVDGPHDQSLLWQRIASDEMPSGTKKLSAKEKETIAKWLDQGARTARAEPANPKEVSGPTPEERAFWSFQPIGKPAVPQVKRSDLVRTPIDAFLLARLEAQGLSFSPQADKRTLIRRATFDLTGLPPTPEEIERFEKDADPRAYERLIDRLLDSPHYGERWARHWLDVAGYADSDGYTTLDRERNYAYKYRDYLIRSFNADRPFSELIREQLAGDEELKPPYLNLTPAEQDKLIATGFLRMGPDGTADGEANTLIGRNEAIAETIKIVSTSLLGLTVGCAQCHNHRYDPISQEDYYRMRAIFEPALDPANWRTPDQRLISLWTDADRKKATEVDTEAREQEKKQAEAVLVLVNKVLEKELLVAPAALREPLKAARALAPDKRNAKQNDLLREYPRVLVDPGNVTLYDNAAFTAITKEYGDKIAKVRAKRPAENQVQALTEVPGKVPVTHFFYRGEVTQPRQAVPPGELTILADQAGAKSIFESKAKLPTSGRRLAYAEYLTSGNHPLVARVLVNRIWLNHFGKGLADTPGDFGILGGRPSHPELLDWLASDWVANRWTLKRLHRQLMTSTAYRQSSKRTPALDAADPDNRLLGRFFVRRLQSEELRDAILAVSGSLHTPMFGPAVPVGKDETGEVVVGQGGLDGDGRPAKKTEVRPEERRRSIYIQVRRSLPLGVLESFDAPLLNPNCERRASSTVAPQALVLMNNRFVVEQAEVLASRTEKEAGKDPIAQIKQAWQRVLGQVPTAKQIETATQFLSQQKTEFAQSAAVKADPKKPAPEHLALAHFCQALFSSNPFLYID